ncbi:OmpP1/FadL family transporter [Duodenibacillus massiliensis]|uniref:OmpP1/FadL family transporter n=1 Tax=Duodenibacillus massiliensis TaxID=1852381 RepID=UPI003AB74527
MKSVAVAGLIAMASSTYAAGFMLTEQSASSLGRAYAGAGVDGTDISGVFYNPATMTLHPGTQIQAGFVAIGLDLDYKGNNGTTENGRANTQPIPFGYISHQATDNVWVGLAMTVPFGMGTEYDDNWFLAKRGISAQVLTFDFNPNVAWKLSEKVSLGAGMSVQYASADLKMEDQADPPNNRLTVDGEINADSWAWGFNVGMMWTPVDNLRFGLSYRSKVNHHAKGDFTVNNFRLGDMAITGPTTKYDAAASLSTPAWLMATAAWDVNDLLSLYATFRWTDWSSFKDLDISYSVGQVTKTNNVHNAWKDTYLVSLGADMRFYDWWTMRAGIGYETSAVDEAQYRTAIIPDADRLWLALGSSFKVAKDFQLDVSAAWLHGIGERDLYTNYKCEGGVKAGRFDTLDAYLLGVQMVYKF